MKNNNMIQTQKHLVSYHKNVTNHWNGSNNNNPLLQTLHQMMYSCKWKRSVTSHIDVFININIIIQYHSITRSRHKYTTQSPKLWENLMKSLEAFHSELLNMEESARIIIISKII